MSALTSNSTRPSCRRSILFAWLFLALTLALDVHGKPPIAVTEAALPVWPQPPEVARIAYVGEVKRPSDLGIQRSTFGKIFNWITGAEKGNEALEKPFGLALDDKENLCLTDTGSGSVAFYDREARKWQR